MKVLQTCDAFYPQVDGVTGVVKNYAEQIMRSNECKVSAPAPAKKSKHVDNEKFEVIRAKSIWAPEHYRYAIPCFDLKYAKKIKAEKFDIIHAHAPFSMGRSALSIAKKQGIPFVATLHTQYKWDFERVLGKYSPFVNFMMWYIMKIYKRADSVWTVSEKAKDILRDYGYKGDIRVIRNATEFKCPETPQELIDRVNKLHNLEGQKNVFVFVGRMSFYKNLKLLCNALKILQDKNQDFKMIFVGGGFDIDKIIKTSKELGIYDKCIFTGTVRDRSLIQAYYLRSDLFVFPSTFDTSGVVITEAAANKKASIVVENTCCAEGIINGENGFIVKECAESLADKLIELCLNPELVKSAGERAHQTLYRTWDMVGEEVQNAYKEIIEEYKLKHKNDKKKK